jgi:hypothetical protein
MSATLDETMVLNMEEYCLYDLIQFALLGRELRLDSNVNHVLNEAALIQSALVPGSDLSKGLVLNKDAFHTLSDKHLVKEYIGQPYGDQPEVVIRHFLSPCPDANNRSPLVTPAVHS